MTADEDKTKTCIFPVTEDKNKNEKVYLSCDSRQRQN